MHDALAGRFLNRDPIGYADSYGLHAFVLNSPTSYVDPFGLSSTSTDGEHYKSGRIRSDGNVYVIDYWIDFEFGCKDGVAYIGTPTWDHNIVWRWDDGALMFSGWTHTMSVVAETYSTPVPCDVDCGEKVWGGYYLIGIRAEFFREEYFTVGIWKVRLPRTRILSKKVKIAELEWEEEFTCCP